MRITIFCEDIEEAVEILNDRKNDSEFQQMCLESESGDMIYGDRIDIEI